MKKSIRTVMALLCAVVAMNTLAMANDNISLVVNDKKVNFDSVPYIINGRTMVPVRAIYEALGVEVEWDNSTGTLTGKKDETIVKMSLDSRIMKVNDVNTAMDCAVMLINGRTYAPARYVAESFGYSVVWSEEENTVYVGEDVSQYAKEEETDENKEPEKENFKNILYSSRPGTIFTTYSSGSPKLLCKIDKFDITSVEQANKKSMKINVFISGDVEYDIDGSGENRVGDRNVNIYLLCYDVDNEIIAKPSVTAKEEGFEIEKSLNVPIETERIKLALEY